MSEYSQIIHHHITDVELADQIHFEGEIPEIVLAVGPVRSVTTLWIRLMAEQGVRTWYQPIKALLRNQMYARNTGLTIPANVKRVFIKETLGVYNPNEASFNPVEVLLAAGVPRDKIKLITVLRDPLTTMASMVDKYKFILGRLEGLNRLEDLIDIFLSSYRQMAVLRTTAMYHDIPMASSIYEAYKSNEPAEVVSALLTKLEIPHDIEKIRRWKPVRELADITIHLDEPDFFYAGSNFFEAVLQSTGIQYDKRSAERVSELLTPEQIKKVAVSGLDVIYDNFRRDCERDASIILPSGQFNRSSQQAPLSPTDSLATKSLPHLFVNTSGVDTEDLAKRTNSLPITKKICREAFERAVISEQFAAAAKNLSYVQLTPEILSSGTDLIVRVLAEHFLKLGFSVAVDNVVPNTHLDAWTTIAKRGGAVLQFAKDFSDFPNTESESHLDGRNMLVCIFGLPGSGKSTKAEAIAREFRMPILPKDLIELAIKVASKDSTPTSEVIRGSAYEFMNVMAGYFLSQGHSVIMDGVTPKEKTRAKWREVAANSNAEIRLIQTYFSSGMRKHWRRNLSGRQRNIEINDPVTGEHERWHEVRFERLKRLKEDFDAPTDPDVLKLDVFSDPKDNIAAMIAHIAGHPSTPAVLKSGRTRNRGLDSSPIQASGV